MGECDGWQKGGPVTVLVEAARPDWFGGVERLSVPGRVEGVYESERLVTVDCGGDSPVWFPFRAADIDQSGRATFRFTDQVGEPE